jgi:hypothetical protein
VNRVPSSGSPVMIRMTRGNKTSSSSGSGGYTGLKWDKWNRLPSARLPRSAVHNGILHCITSHRVSNLATSYLCEMWQPKSSVRQDAIPTGSVAFGHPDGTGITTFILIPIYSSEVPP